MIDVISYVMSNSEITFNHCWYNWINFTVVVWNIVVGLFLRHCLTPQCLIMNDLSSLCWIWDLIAWYRSTYCEGILFRQIQKPRNIINILRLGFCGWRLAFYQLLHFFSLSVLYSISCKLFPIVPFLLCQRNADLLCCWRALANLRIIA